MSNARVSIVALVVLLAFVAGLAVTGPNDPQTKYEPFVPSPGSQVFVQDLA